MSERKRKKPAEVTVREATLKTVARIEAMLETDDLLTPRDISVLADALRHAAQVLGVQTALDDEEQRAKIGVLLARADGSGKAPGVVRIEWGEEVDELAK